MKPIPILFCCLLSACANSPVRPELSTREQSAITLPTETKALSAIPVPKASAAAPTSAPAVPVVTPLSQPLTGSSNLKGRIDFADVDKAKLTSEAKGLRTQQIAGPQFVVRVFIQNCDDLLAEIQTDGEFRISGLPENVPLDVDVYALSNLRLQMRAQITLHDSETSLIIEPSSTALALLFRFLEQNQSPSQEIPAGNFETDSQLQQVLSDLTAGLLRHLGQETLRSLQYQADWNNQLTSLQSQLEGIIQARPELLQVLPTPAASVTPPDTVDGSGGSSGGGGGGSSPISNQETVGGNINLEGL